MKEKPFQFSFVFNPPPLGCDRAAVHACLVLALVCLLGGCSKSDGTLTVRGQVTFRGKAIDSGVLTFYPQQGRPTMTNMAAGKYSTALAPGEYTATVEVVNALPPGFKEGDPMPPPKIVLPAEYTTRAKSTLKASVQVGQDQPIDFVLK